VKICKRVLVVVDKAFFYFLFLFSVRNGEEEEREETL